MAKGGFPYRGGNMGGANMANMMKQAQKMQAEMLKAQEELSEKTAEASSGGGAVTAKVSGAKELVSLTIDPEAFSQDDIEMLQDMVISAVNEAMKKADEMASSSMQKITGGLNIPGLF